MLKCKRRLFLKLTGRYVSIITDGGIRTGGELCKSFVAGADAVMIGSPFSKTFESPAKGNHWGMATPHESLPRGTRIEVGSTGSLERIIKGPALLDDGTHNLLGAIRTSMSTLGAKNIKEMQKRRNSYCTISFDRGESISKGSTTWNG